MKFKHVRLTVNQIEDLKGLIDTTIESTKDDEDQEGAEEYCANLNEIYECLEKGAPDCDTMASEIHALKNKVMGLEM